MEQSEFEKLLGGTRRRTVGVTIYLTPVEDGADPVPFEVEFKTLTVDQHAELLKLGEAETRYQQLAFQTVAPEMSAEQWQQLANSERVTIGQFAEIMAAANSIVYEVVDAPKESPVTSPPRKARASSKS